MTVTKNIIRVYDNTTCEAQVIPVNTVGVAGAGLAKVYAEVYPEWEQAYKEYCEFVKWNPGKVLVHQLCDCPQHKPNYLIAFPTKKHWRDPSKLKYIDKGMDGLIVACERLGIKTVAMPQIGCGLGGLEWEDVKNVIYKKAERLKELNICICFV